MITLCDILNLADNKHIQRLSELNDAAIDKICKEAYEDIDDVVYQKQEYPVFFHYIVLCYLNDKGLKFCDLSDNDKRRYAEDTIEEIKRVWNLGNTQQMVKFLNEARKFCMPYKFINIGFDTITYRFNSQSHAEDYCVLADMLNIKHIMEKDNHEYIVKLLF